jgi:hypothetical protein
MDEKMKILVPVLKFLFVLVLGVSLSYLLTSCKSETIVESGEVNVDILSELPVVTKTANNYTAESLQNTFSHTEIHNRFTEAYKKSYTTSLKESIEGYVLIDIAKIGENPAEFTECYNSIGEFKERQCLPCMVESAKYEGKEAYIVVFNWGIGKEDLGHIAFYVIDKSTKKILDWTSCR